jgi:hypothetical protein
MITYVIIILRLSVFLSGRPNEDDLGTRELHGIQSKVETLFIPFVFLFRFLASTTDFFTSCVCILISVLFNNNNSNALFVKLFCKPTSKWMCDFIRRNLQFWIASRTICIICILNVNNPEDGDSKLHRNDDGNLPYYYCQPKTSLRMRHRLALMSPLET